MKKENKTIKEAINLLENGQYREIKEYLTQLKEKGVAAINGYTFQKEPFCWVIWKPTDIGEEPQYKGESLCKVVPRTDCDVETILAAQSWEYV